MTVADLIFVVLFALLAAFSTAVVFAAACVRVYYRTQGPARVLSDVFGQRLKGSLVIFDHHGKAAIMREPAPAPEPPTPRSPGVVVPIDSARKERPRA